MTESGVGPRADLEVRAAGTGLIKDSVDELLCLALDFSLAICPVDDVDGRFGKFASVS